MKAENVTNGATVNMGMTQVAGIKELKIASATKKAMSSGTTYTQPIPDAYKPSSNKFLRTYITASVLAYIEINTDSQIKITPYADIPVSTTLNCIIPYI